MELSEKLRLKRKEHKKTQKDIADYLGMTESGYGYYEQGRNKPSVETLEKLCVLYEVQMDFWRSDSKPKGNFAYYGGGDDWTEEDKAEAQDEVRKALAQRARAKLFEALGKETVDKLMQLPEADQEMALQQLKQTVEFLNKKNKQEN